jgi:hypothetical protein
MKPPSQKSMFQLSTCPFDTDTIVNTVAWSHGDNICAMATSTMNDDDRELHHIHFMNNEVNYYDLYMNSYYGY